MMISDEEGAGLLIPSGNQEATTEDDSCQDSSDDNGVVEARNSGKKKAKKKMSANHPSRTGLSRRSCFIVGALIGGILVLVLNDGYEAYRKNQLHFPSWLLSSGGSSNKSSSTSNESDAPTTGSSSAAEQQQQQVVVSVRENNNDNGVNVPKHGESTTAGNTESSDRNDPQVAQSTDGTFVHPKDTVSSVAVNAPSDAPVSFRQSNPIPAILPATLMPIVPESQQAASINGSNPNNNSGNGFSCGHVQSVGVSNNDSSLVSSSTTTTTKAVSPLQLSIPAPASQHNATPWTNDLCSTTAESTVTASRL